MTALRDHSHRLLVIVGASGAGKDSVLHGWLAALPASGRPHRARRTITRAAADPSEDHEAIDESVFQATHAGGGFAFAWQAHGLHYGIRWSELVPLTRGNWVAMNGSRAHLVELCAAAPHAHVVEIVAHDDIRRARLSGRGREAATGIADRLARPVHMPDPDLSIDNGGDLSAAVARLDAWWQQIAVATSRP